MKIDPYLSPCTKLKSKWMKDLNIKPDIVYQKEDKLGKNLKLVGTRRKFSNWNSNDSGSKIKNWDFRKLEGLCKAKGNQ